MTWVELGRSLVKSEKFEGGNLFFSTEEKEKTTRVLNSMSEWRIHTGIDHRHFCSELRRQGVHQASSARRTRLQQQTSLYANDALNSGWHI